jgi:ATP phosphoribosyltransferase
VAIKLALPKGRLLRKTAALLQKAGWCLDEYHSEMGFYRPHSEKYPDVLIRAFHEKDIPIQIALGNYDIGICCLDWIEEMTVKYPASGLVKVRALGYGQGSLYIASASPLEKIKSDGSLVRIASEYPNLAESFALRERLDRFSIFGLWGAAEAYPPENADMVLLSADSTAGLAENGMRSVRHELDYSAFLIANRKSLESKDLKEIIDSIGGDLSETPPVKLAEEAIRNTTTVVTPRKATDQRMVRLALPDGHQQKPAAAFLRQAGIGVADYPSATANRRPAIDIDGVTVKVIRPQDMPLHVANGNFDLAVTGRDWLREHLCQFPASPVRELLGLGFSRVRLVAVVHQDLSVDDAGELSKYVSAQEKPLRVASEYVNLADWYARENHLGHYLVIPTFGASEAFLPDDADLLIENTETGRTIKRHNLKIVDTLFESTSCLIGSTSVEPDSPKSKIIKDIVARMREAVEADE